MSRATFQNCSALVYTVGILISTLLGLFLAKLFINRSQFLRLKRQGLVKMHSLADRHSLIGIHSLILDKPMPPYNPILGHLPVIFKLMSKLPSDCSNQYLPGLLRRAYPDLGPNFYMDTWPFGAPVLVISEPSALHQITQEHSLPKHPDLREFLRPLSNGQDIVTMEGQMWKTWRNIFNPGFSLANLMTLSPVIVQETLVLCDVLQNYAGRRTTVSLKDLTDRWTMDVIGNVVL